MKIFFKNGSRKIFFSFVTPFLSKKRGHEKSMTEMPEIASDGVKMNFGHKEFVPRKKIEVCRTFRGCFRGR